jgi:hypothetical protein
VWPTLFCLLLTPMSVNGANANANEVVPMLMDEVVPMPME